jgi:hypothetical protein
MGIVESPEKKMFNYALYAKAITFRSIPKTETVWGSSSPQWCISLFTPLEIMVFFHR